MQLHRFGDFTALRTALPLLATDAPAASLFETCDWFALFAGETLPAAARLHLFAASDEATAVCLPLVSHQGQLLSLSNYYSGLYGPLLGGNPSPAWLSGAFAALCRDLRRALRPAVVRLQPVAEDSETGRALQAGFRQAGYLVGDHFAFGNWYLPCAGLRFAEFFAARPAALRNTIRRARRRLDKEGPWQIDIHSAPGPALERAIADFEAIYRKSWKPDESHPGFIRQLCLLAARRGWLRLGILQRDGIAIASQIWLFDNGSARIFKLAYDPDAARYSPGSVLTAALMEYALDRDAAREIDYLSGDDAYKQDWMSQRRERRGLLAFDPATARGLFAAFRHFAGRRLRQRRSA